MNPDTLNEIFKTFEHLTDMLHDGYADVEIIDAVEAARCLLEESHEECEEE